MRKKYLSSSEPSTGQDHVVQSYRKRSARYDDTVNVFNLFRSFGFDIPTWWVQAVEALGLKTGDQVVDIGCGTGLNFPILQEAIGPDGHIIGVDLSDAMLEKAQQQVHGNSWQNVELVCADAARYEFPPNVDGILSTFALTLVPQCRRAVENGCRALRPGGRFSVLDMAWPDGWSFHWRHMVFFLRSYGVTRGTLERRAWESVWKTMDENLTNVTLIRFWFDFMYLASGKRDAVDS
jgi:demethylmenaquinone methyltransferase/2-methoxy-6-polyprenyl-1,4-benzoquinol methylase